jgi:hypothetical protein
MLSSMTASSRPYLTNTESLASTWIWVDQHHQQTIYFSAPCALAARAAAHAAARVLTARAHLSISTPCARYASSRWRYASLPPTAAMPSDRPAALLPPHRHAVAHALLHSRAAHVSHSSGKAWPQTLARQPLLAPCCRRAFTTSLQHLLQPALLRRRRFTAAPHRQ